MNLNAEIFKYEKQAISASTWFYFVAVLSVVNCLSLLFEWNWRFFVGLISTDLATISILDASRRVFSTDSLRYLAIAAAVLIPAIAMTVIGYFAGKKNKTALVSGLVLITLDTFFFFYLLSIIEFDISMLIGIAFHIWIIASTGIALSAVIKLPKLRVQLADELAKQTNTQVIQSDTVQTTDTTENTKPDEIVNNQ